MTIYDASGVIPHSGYGEPGTALHVRVLMETGKLNRFQVLVYREYTFPDGRLDTDEQVIEVARMVHGKLGEMLRMVESDE